MTPMPCLLANDGLTMAEQAALSKEGRRALHLKHFTSETGTGSGTTQEGVGSSLTAHTLCPAQRWSPGTALSGPGRVAEGQRCEVTVCDCQQHKREGERREEPAAGAGGAYTSGGPELSNLFLQRKIDS